MNIRILSNKKVRKVAGVLSFATLALALASCDASRNTKTPTGSLNLKDTYASLATGETLTYSEMYNKLRSKGYDSVLQQIKTQLFQKEISTISYSSYKEDYDEAIVAAVFGVSTVDSFKDLDEDDIKEKIATYIDTFYDNNGVILSNLYSGLYSQATETSTEASLYPSVAEDGSYICNWPTEVVDKYTYSIAIVEYAKKYLYSIKDKETVIDVDGDKVDNSYYIESDDIKSGYETIINYTSTADLLGITYDGQNEDEHYTNHAVIINFATENSANSYVEKTNQTLGYTLNDDNLTKEQVLDYYVTLYNLRYTSRDTLTTSSVYGDEHTTFYYNEDTDDLNDLSSNAKTFIYDSLYDYGSEEGPSYLKTPRNISGDNQYYMILRLNVYEGDKYDELQSSLSDELKTTLDNELIDNIIDDWATESYANTLVTNRLKSSNFSLKIYDPVYENKYNSSYNDYYSFTKSFKKDLVFSFTYTYEDDAIEYAGQKIEGSYSVDDSFAYLEALYGAEISTSFLANKYLLNCTTLTSLLDDDNTSNYKSSVKNIVKNFKKNYTSYSKKMGLSNYLVLTYGYATEDEVYNYEYLCQELLTIYTSYYGDFISTDGRTTFTDTGLFALLKKYTDKTYDAYYNLSISHILIAVDEDLDGTNDDPEEFLEEISSNQTIYDLFVQELTRLADAIVKEASIMTCDFKDALTNIAKTFNNEGYGYILKCDDYQGLTWADFKTNFRFTLRAEDLGEISNSNGSNYVEAFTDEVKSLYNTLAKDEYSDIVEKIENDGYFKYTDSVAGTNGVSSIDELTATVYGWHMLYVYDLTEQDNCKFTSDDDTTSSTDATYKTWEHKEITIYPHDDDTTDDDENAYASGYSSDNYASVDQLFIYFFEQTNDGSVTSMKSALVSTISTYFSDVMSRYTSSSFVTWKLYQQIGTITYNANANNTHDFYIETLERGIDGYEELEQDDIFYDWFEQDWTIALTHK